jgi:hypothetical protein
MLAMLRVLVLGAALVGAALVTGTWSALAAVAVSCAVAALIDGRRSALALIAGSLAALLHTALGGAYPVLAGALWCALVWSPRAARGPDGRSRGAVVALALLGGGAASWTAARFGADPSAAVRMAAVLVAGLLASAGALVAVDDPVATALRWAMLPTREPVDAALARALDLRRRAALAEVTQRVDAETAARVERAWASLADLGRDLAAARSRGAAPGWMVARVESHVTALERAHERLDAHLASSVRVADPRLAEVELANESLELEVRALDEVSGSMTPPMRSAPETSAP